MAHYAFLNNDATTGTLREELEVLYTEMGTLTSIEDPTEEDTAAIEAKQAEIDAKQQEIDNALCVVTGVITGVLETHEVAASDETLEQEIKDLELLSPFGQKNPEPIFKVENVKIDILQIFKNKHAKLKIFDDLNYECEGMFFDIISEDLKFYLGKKSNFDCYFKVKKDSYSNKTVIHLEDIH